MKSTKSPRKYLNRFTVVFYVMTEYINEPTLNNVWELDQTNTCLIIGSLLLYPLTPTGFVDCYTV